MKRVILIFLLTMPVFYAAEKTHEMERYRQIAGKAKATVQDMVDLILMTRGEFDKHPDEAKRFEYARNEGWVRRESPGMLLDRGTLAFALIINYNITRGWLFRLTHWKRYALRDAQEAGVLSPRLGERNTVSGAQLVGAVTAAEEYKAEKAEWSAHH